MTSMRLIIGLAAAALVLTGCAPGGGTSPTTDPVPTETTIETPEPAAVILSLEGLTLVDTNGDTLEATQFSDPQPVLALLDELLGSTPDPEVYPEYDTTAYSWGDDLTFSIRGEDYSWVRVNVAELGGLPVQTAAGIQVGSSRDDLLAQDVYDPQYDFDTDGFSDFYGLEPVTNNDYESLSFPGQPGTDYIEAQLQGDTVSTLASPSNDYTDV
ncbi:MAG TPA: hypothetical protein VL294_08190 [Pseudolysinimonas sp.]|nr:hypothetical protein [Pseudolysinimonas sp.]